jgi:hypothetical protein
MGVPREGVVWTLGVVRGLIYILEGTKGYIYIYIYTHTPMHDGRGCPGRQSGFKV